MIKRPPAERGAALLLTFIMMLVLAALALAVGVMANNGVVSGRSQLVDKQAVYFAEAGWQRARQALSAGTWTVGNTYTESFDAATYGVGGEYQVSITNNGDSTYTITSSGYVPNSTAPAAQRRIVEASMPVNNTSTNQSLTATASASSSQGGNTPDKANDGNTGTRWRAGTAGSNEWLAMDYGAGLRTLNRIVILERDNIDGVTIEISCDGSNWTVVPGLSVVESPALTWTATFASTRERYFRARFTVPAGLQASVEEMQSFAPAYGFGSVTTQW